MLAAAGVAVLALRPGRGTALAADVPWIGAGLGVLGLLAGLNSYAELEQLEQAASWAAGWLGIGLCAASLAVIPIRYPAAAMDTHPAVLTAGSAVAGFSLGQVPALLARAAAPDVRVALPVVALCGSAFLATTLVARLALPSWVAAGTSWLAGLPVLATAGTAGTAGGLTPRTVAVYFGIVAISLYSIALVRGRAWLAWPGAMMGTIAGWLLLGDAGASPMELFTGTSAALLLAAGVVLWRQDRSLGSLVVLGPALGMAALPSAVLALGQAASGSGQLRAVVVILAGTALAAGGAARGGLAALLVGLVAALVAGVGQVLALVDLVPRWVALAIGGILLVTAGFRAEALGRTGWRLWRATGRMR